MAGTKYSRKRDAILAAIRETDTHPTAEWVYARLKPEIPDLSLGTVYRNIALFKRNGTITPVCTVGGQERYDGATDGHTHFICEGCGAVLDVHSLSVTPDMEAAGELLGARVDRSALLLYGQCKNCLK